MTVLEGYKGTKLSKYLTRVVCPNFGHPVLTRHFRNIRHLQVKNSFAKIVSELSVLKVFQLLNSDLLLSYYAYSIYKVR